MNKHQGPTDTRANGAYLVGWRDAEQGLLPTPYDHEGTYYQTAYTEGYTAYVQMKGQA